MEYTPRFSAETNSASSPEKKTSPDRREGPLRVPGLAKIEAGEGGPQRARGFHEAAMQTSERQDDETKDKKSKKRKRKKAATATPKDEAPKDVQPKGEVNALDAIAAEIAAKAKDKPRSEPGEQRVENSELVDEKSKGAADEAYEELPSQELPLHAISGGEVIIDLAALRGEHGQTPEYELPLRAEDIQPVSEKISEKALPGEEVTPPVVSEHDSESPSPASTEAVNETASAAAANAAPESGEPVPAAGGGGEPPYVPPENHRNASPEFPEPERHATGYPIPSSETQYVAPTAAMEDSGSVVYASAMPPLAPRMAMAAAEQLVTKRELDSAVTDAENSGASRGLLTGLIVGGAYEHFKHKRREKRQEKKHQQVTKKLEQARADYQFAAAEQTRKQDITEHQLHIAERRLAESQQTGFGIPPRPEDLARTAASSPEKSRPPVSAAERFSAPRSEGAPGQQAPEVRQKSEKPAIIDPEQGIEIPADQRLIREGAFIAQVEKATGKVVENPSFAYGHEYHRERAQEAALLAQQTIATGEVAVAAALAGKPDQRQHANGGPVGGGGAAGGGSLPAPVIPSATTQGPPSRTPSTSNMAANSSDDSSAQQPLWPWVVALVVIVIALFVLLR